MMRQFTKCLRCYGSVQTPKGPIFLKTTFQKRILCGNVKHNLTFFSSKNLHFSTKHRRKIFTDIENSFAHDILPPLKKMTILQEPENHVTSLEDFEKVLNQNWRTSNASLIVETFEKVKSFSVLNEINLSDKRFDKLVDGLMDHCEKLTDEELLRLLCTISEFPPCESSTSHNFHDIWSCLDDICCWKMANWDLEKMFTFAEVWYKLNLARLSDFLYEVLDKVSNKPHRLSKNILLYTCFYLNVRRKKVVPFELEHALAERIEEFSLDELGVIAMGYFKTKSKVKLRPIIAAMIRAISENCEKINEITLSAMLKTIRLSQNVETAPEIRPMLDKLSRQIPRLSNMSLIHIALVGTSLQIRHAQSILACAQKLVKDIENVRLKDIERILLVCSMFDLDTNPSIFELSLQELFKESRRKEFIQYNRCLTSTLHYLSLKKIYPYPFLDEVLNPEYIAEVYGKRAKELPRELFSLDISISIECPDYQGHRISPTIKYKAAKWLTEYTPTHTQPKRLTLSDKYYLDLVEHVTRVVGDVRLLRSSHVLPHFSKSDIILCRNRLSGEFVEPFGFENYVLGDVFKPLEQEKFEWFAIVALTPNLTVRDEVRALGSMLMKDRQLRAIGYNPVFVHWNEFSDLSAQEKLDFLAKRLDFSISDPEKARIRKT